MSDQADKKEVENIDTAIRFYQKDENIELLKLSNEGFFYKGEKVEDVHNVYERFNEWLNQFVPNVIKK